MSFTPSPRLPASNAGAEHRPAGGPSQQSQPRHTQKANFDDNGAPMNIDAPSTRGHAHTVTPNAQAGPQFDPRLPAQYRGKHVPGVIFTPLERPKPIPSPPKCPKVTLANLPWYECPFRAVGSIVDCPKSCCSGADLLAHAERTHAQDGVGMLLWLGLCHRMSDAEILPLWNWTMSRPAGWLYA